MMGFPGGSAVKYFLAVQKIWVQSLGWDDPLEKGMATHFSILAWRISWTKEPGGLQSMGCKGSDTTERLTHFQGLFGNSKKLQFEHAIYGKPQACSETKERESAFMGKMGKLQGMF